MYINFVISPYTVLVISILFGTLIGIIIYFISYIFILKNLNNEKTSVYECGFDPFSTTEKTFDVRYYLVSLLFIIFDLELSFLFPWSLFVKQLGFDSFCVVFFFILILSLGFVYEWLQGALDWSSVY